MHIRMLGAEARIIMRRCYIDCTNTLYEGLNTGIQRVVRNIISRCSLVHGGIMEFIPVFASQGKFYYYEDVDADPLVASRVVNNVLGGIRNIVDRVFDAATNEDGNNAGSIVHDSYGIGAAWHDRIIRQSRKLVPLILRGAFLIDKFVNNLRPVAIHKGDVLFLADIFWNPVLLSAVRRMSRSETINIVLIYDVFPVSYPQFVHKINIDGFLEHLPFIVERADGIISISRSALDEIKTYGLQAGYRPLYDYFHLGADFKNEPLDAGSVRKHIRDSVDGEAVYLMVGTIEPRKNHPFVLETFRRLWEQGFKGRLCIVGRIGWKCKDTLEAIYSSPQYGKCLFMINDATDSELNYCYTRAKAVIISSFAEGFGLPLVEALHFRKQVFASDIPVFREIGGGFPVYFSLDRPDELQEKIIAWKDGDSSAGGRVYEALSWDASIADLFAKIARMAEAVDRQGKQSHVVQRTDA